MNFFFWLDVISTLSILLDIGWVSEQLFQSGGSTSLQSTASLARAGRASKIGARAGRIVRIMRLIRLVKLYKHAQQALLEKEKKQQLAAEKEKSDYRDVPIGASDYRRGSISNFNFSSVNPLERRGSLTKIPFDPNSSGMNNTMIQNIEEDDFNNSQELPSPGIQKSSLPILTEENDEKAPALTETNLGRKLSDLTTKRVITIVLAVIISIPLLQQTTYVEKTTVMEGFLSDIYALKNKPCTPIFDLTVNTMVDKYKDSSLPLVFLELQHSNISPNCPSIIYEKNSTALSSLRTIERSIYIHTEDLVAFFDNRESIVLGAWLSIGRTIFICIVLTYGALMFSNDANSLVLAPIESMVEKVKRIAKNPLEAAQIEENEAFAKELVEKEKEETQLKEFDKRKLTKEEKRKLKKELKQKNKQEKEESNYETQILERTIIKIGALLALGFGEAGSEIIAKNMEKSFTHLSYFRW